MNGQRELANYFSRECSVEELPEMEEAWKEWDEEEAWYDKQETDWKLSVPTAKERVQGFINDGSITEEWAENTHRKFLQLRYEELIREFYENKEVEVPKELKKIFFEYNFRYEGGTGITEDQIEQAHNYPISKLVEVKNNFIACPFHNEKTPSMHITINKYFCHGCSEGGDTIKFVMKKDNLSFRGAVKHLTSL